MSEPEQTQNTEPISVKRLVYDAVTFTVIAVAVVSLAGYLFREPLTTVAHQLIDWLGHAGMFIGVFIADAFTFPLPPDAYLLLGVASGADVSWTLTVCSLASVVGGQVAYSIGPYIRQIPILKERLEEYRAEGQYLFAEWGAWSVGIAAMTPIPFSIVSWLAGIYQMRYSSYLAASLIRVPRIVGYYYLYEYGWAPTII